MAIAAALLVLAAAGTRAREVTHLSTIGLLGAAAGPLQTVVGAVLVAAGCLVLAGVVVLARRRRERDDEDMPTESQGRWWARAVGFLAALALAALPVAAVVEGIRHPGTAWLPEVALAAPHLHGASRAPPAAVSATGLLAVLAVLALVGVLAAAALWRRRRRARLVLRGPGGAGAPLAAAVAAGGSALRGEDSAREAIIACYAAMEEALAAAGSPRLPADTPEELLARATDEGTIRTPAARRLTALFREARFSPHELTGTHRQAARECMDEIGRDLAAAP
jgi:hypothetical protein